MTTYEILGVLRGVRTKKRIEAETPDDALDELTDEFDAHHITEA